MQAHIITLRGHELSERLSQECRAQAAKFNITALVFDAIWGKDYAEHASKLNIHIHPTVPNSKMTIGHYGNFLSHFYLWQQCVKDAEPYLILEHDGYFIKPLPNNILDQFIDVLKLDSIDPYRKDYENVIADEFNMPLCIRNIKPSKIKQAGGYTWGCYAYIIKPHAAQKLINWVKEYGFLPTDNQIGLGILDIKTCYPTVARMHPFLCIGDNIYTQSTAAYT
jgi:GR25 family glycosyltransferase involved in LPS biosynthesis